MRGYQTTAAIFLALAGPQATAQVYKCPGEDGTPVYQQVPCPDDQPTVGETPTPRPPPEEDKQIQDATAWIEKHRFDGRIVCSIAVEELAQYKHRWTDGLFGTRFPTVTLVSRKTGFILFAGDNIEMLNGFGAWLPVDYGCVFDPDAGTASAFLR